MAKAKRLTLSIPPPLEDGGCDAGCPLYYVAVVETRGVWSDPARAHVCGCSAERAERRGVDAYGNPMVCPGPRCPWGRKEAGR